MANRDLKLIISIPFNQTFAIKIKDMESINDRFNASFQFKLPAWLETHESSWSPTTNLEKQTQYVINLAEKNVRDETGGPFAAAIFEIESGQLISTGLNLVVANNNSMLHAEVVAIMRAENRLGRYSLNDNKQSLRLVSSCEPCAMCLGAIFWSGLKRVASAAERQDAESCGFDEGPVFDATYQYLNTHGIEFIHGILREDAQTVFKLYLETQGDIYNP